MTPPGSVAQRLKALEEDMHGPMFTEPVGEALGIKALKVPEFSRIAVELASIRAEVEDVAKHAAIICTLLELGDDRLLASDGPAGGQLPDLSPDEWGKVYQSAMKIATRLSGEEKE